MLASLCACPQALVTKLLTVYSASDAAKNKGAAHLLTSHLHAVVLYARRRLSRGSEHEKLCSSRLNIVVKRD